ncbi:MAG: 7TM diverse intracellular signaling domain-containing protein [Oligoflexus sp.]
MINRLQIFTVFFLLILSCSEQSIFALEQNIINIDGDLKHYNPKAGDISFYKEKNSFQTRFIQNKQFRELYHNSKSPKEKSQIVADYYDKLYELNQSLSIWDILSKYSEDQFTVSSIPVPNHGLSSEVFWYQIKIHYDGQIDQEFLFMANGYFRDIQYFVIHEGEIIQQERSGSYYYPEVRPIYEWGGEFGIPITLSPNRPNLSIFFKTHSDGTSNNFALKIFSPEHYQLEKRKWYMTPSFYFGSTAGLFIYNLLIFFVSRKSGYLYYSLFLAASINIFLILNTFTVFWPDLIGGIYIAEYFIFSHYIAWICFFLFVRNFLRIHKFSPLMNRCFYGLIVIAIILALLHFTQTTKLAHKVTNDFSILCGIYILGIAAILAFKKDKNAILFLAAFSLLLTGLVVYSFFSRCILARNLFTENAFQIGSFLEAILLSMALGDRLRHLSIKISRANDELRKYIGQVEELVEQKTRHIRSIMAHIKQGIFSILPSRQIHEDYSYYLENLVNQTNLQGKDPVSLIFQSSHMSPDDIEKAVSALDTSLDSAFGFEANACHLPREIRYQDKILELDWQIITASKSDVTEKILVVVRDVTELRQLEVTSIRQKRELSRIGEMIALPPNTCRRFLSQWRQLLEESAHLLQTPTGEIRKLYINYPTLKGLARAYQFKELVDQVHRAEETCSCIPSIDIDTQREKLFHDLHGIFDLLKDYETLYFEKLGRQSIENRGLTEKDLENGLMILDQIPAQFQDLVQPLRQSLSTHYYQSSESLLSEIFSQAEGIAQDLGKANPKIILPTESLLFTPKASRLLRDVLIHLLRNALDHGLESPKERLAKGKPERGKLTLEWCSSEKGLSICFFDDGKGLNIRRIQQVAWDKDLIDRHCDDINHIAQLIFRPGFSTAEKISDISGRGMGIDAARAYLEENGGSLHVTLLNKDITSEFIPAKFDIFIPHYMYIPCLRLAV